MSWSMERFTFSQDVRLLRANFDDVVTWSEFAETGPENFASLRFKAVIFVQQGSKVSHHNCTFLLKATKLVTSRVHNFDSCTGEI